MTNSKDRNIFMLAAFLLLTGIFTSCKENKEVHFHYSDGTQIKDSTVIRFLEKQIPVQVGEIDTTRSLEIETFLDKKIHQKLKTYIRKDTSRKVSAMLILENKTGNVVYCQNSEQFSAFSQRIQVMKFYGILLSLENGVKPEDNYSWIGKYTKKKFDSTVARLYRISAPSLEYKYPYDDYSCGKWSAFLQKLNVSENERDCADGEIYPRYYFRTSLFDLVKTGVLVSQNGVAGSHNLFGKIKDGDGKTVYKPALVKEKKRILKTKTCLVVKKILKRDQSDVIEFNYPIFHYSQRQIKNGQIVSCKKYTIGFLAASKSAKAGYVNEDIYELVSLLEGSGH